MLFLRLVVLAILFLLLIRPIQAALLYTRPPRIQISYRTPASFGVAYKEVILHSRDGVRLSAWYVPPKNGAAVLLLHRQGSNRLGVMFHAEALVRAGYGVLMPDLRRHGRSGGRVFGRGEAERDDVLAAVTYLRHRPEINPGGIGIFGHGIGGLLALQAVSRTVAIRAVAVSAPSPANMEDFPAPKHLWERLTRWPLQRLYLALVQRLSGGQPLPATAAILPRVTQALLIIPSGRAMERRVAHHLFAAATTPKQFWEMPPDSMSNSLEERLGTIQQQLVAFFDLALMRQEAGDWIEPDWDALSAPAAFPEPAPVLTEFGEVDYDATISGARANGLAFLLLPFCLTVFVGTYWLVWGERLNAQLGQPPALSWLLLLFAVAIVLHEGIHALGFIAWGGAPMTAIRFGFSWKMLAPYAHCRAPVDIRSYRIAVGLPSLLLGLIPAIIGIGIGSFWLTLFAAMMTIAAAGDLAVLLAVRKVHAGARVLDHPRAAGCRVLKEPSG